jgi:hypothetical protein
MKPARHFTAHETGGSLRLSEGTTDEAWHKEQRRNSSITDLKIRAAIPIDDDDARSLFAPVMSVRSSFWIKHDVFR